MTIDVILTFEDADQKRFRVDFLQSPSEAQFLQAVFARMRTGELQMLRKISAAQICDSEEDVLPWLLKSNGKYYFGLA